VKPAYGMLRTLGFGAVSAVGALGFQFTLQPWLGSLAVAAYALLCSCAFPVAVAPSLRAAALALALCVPLAVGAAVVTPDANSALLAAALIASLGRALSYRSKPARALFLEVILLAGGLVAVRLFGGRSPFGVALGIWSYCLVQSLYFAFLTPAARAGDVPAGDAFDLAHRRALALLERR
jgi:hypothetical protein